MHHSHVLFIAGPVFTDLPLWAALLIYLFVLIPLIGGFGIIYLVTQIISKAKKRNDLISQSGQSSPSMAVAAPASGEYGQNNVVSPSRPISPQRLELKNYALTLVIDAAIAGVLATIFVFLMVSYIGEWDTEELVYTIQITAVITFMVRVVLRILLGGSIGDRFMNSPTKIIPKHYFTLLDIAVLVVVCVLPVLLSTSV